MLDQAWGENPDAVTQWFDQAAHNLNPRLDPISALRDVAATKPLVEVFGSDAGYDFFKQRPIINQQLSDLNVKDQYYRSTTEFAKIVGAKMGIAPVKVEHLLNSYSGGMYRRLLKEKSGIADIPFIGGLAVRQIPSQSIKEFYEEHQRIKREYNSQRKNGGEVDPDVKMQWRLIDDARKRMGDIRRGGADGTKEEYQAAQDQIIAIARKALDKEGLESFQSEASATDAIKRAKSLTRMRPAKATQRKEWEADIKYSLEWYRSQGMSKAEIVKAYSKHLRKEVKNPETRRNNMTRLRRQLNRL